MATMQFWGGVGVIGSSKVVVRDGGHRVLLDLGTDIPRDGDLFRAPAGTRPGRGLADRLRVGAAPAIPGLFDPAALDPGDRLAEPGEPTAVFVTHPHIDHVGLAGFIRPDVPVHTSPDSARLLRALAGAGEGLAGGDPDWIEVGDGEPVAVGPMRVERIPVDHDVPGASGYLVHTGDGILAFTGDYRFHGHHPELSWGFAERVAGCDVLVTEGTTLSFEEYHPLRTEADTERSFAEALDGNPDLVLLTVYPRDVERVERFVTIAAAAGRTIVWPDRVAAFLAALGVPDPLSHSALGLDGLRAAPGEYVFQIDADRLTDLLDLPAGPATVFLHANGEPLGPFEPRWQLFTEWLARLGIERRQIGNVGHAYQDDTHRFLHRIAPKVVVPIHTLSPYRLHPVGATTRLVVDYARSYDFAGRPAAD
ncbi:MAG TPA: MBL fold metallo-hydrolase [Actinocrinis sp.]|nr:MBL fold metallo-hydrolase [Actinocrinis sp.]